jgi:hypothetical protein
VAQQSPALPVDLFAPEDPALAQRAAEWSDKRPFTRVLTFGKLLAQTPFVADMRQMLQVLQQAYDYPVDTEFTANFVDDESYRINLVQCRPLQVSGSGVATDLPARMDPDNVVLEARGAVIGRSRVSAVDRIVYVVPAVYGKLSEQDRYRVARLIGEVLHPDPPQPAMRVLLIGPGRWGTTTPWLGVPVSFAEINNVSFMCEVVAMSEEIVPDVSLGTHFFSDLVEQDILYMALFPSRKDNRLNREVLETAAPNLLGTLLPQAAAWSHAIRVMDFADRDGRGGLWINANAIKQQVVCYLNK